MIKKLDNERMYFYEKFASEFDSKVNMYDTNMRLSVFFDDLIQEELVGQKLLDAGCGTGWFSAEAVKRGATVTSLDLGNGLLGEVKKKCDSKRVVGSVLNIPFVDNTFDYVLSSEVIEHVTNPKQALHEMYRVLRKDGVLVISTPNKAWYWSLYVAKILNLRPYQGLENWSNWEGLTKDLTDIGFSIEQKVGIHSFPFVIPLLNPLLNFMHRYRFTFLRLFMVNIAIRCKK